MAADAAGWLVKWLQMQLGVALGHSMWLAMAPCAGSKTLGPQAWGGGDGGSSPSFSWFLLHLFNSYLFFFIGFSIGFYCTVLVF